MRKKFRKITAVILTAAMAFSVATPALAENIPDNDVVTDTTINIVTNEAFQDLFAVNQNTRGASGDVTIEKVEYDYSFAKQEENNDLADVTLSFVMTIGGQEYSGSANGTVNAYSLSSGDVLWEGPIESSVSINNTEYDVLIGFSKLESGDEIQASVTIQSFNGESMIDPVVFTFGEIVISGDIHREIMGKSESIVLGEYNNASIEQDDISLLTNSDDENYTYVDSGDGNFKSNTSGVSGIGQTGTARFDSITGKLAVSINTYGDYVDAYLDRYGFADTMTEYFKIRLQTITTGGTGYMEISNTSSYDFGTGNYNSGAVLIKTLFARILEFLDVDDTVVDLVFNGLYGTTNREISEDDAYVEMSFGATQVADFDTISTGVPIVFVLQENESVYTGNTRLRFTTTLRYRTQLMDFTGSTAQWFYFNTEDVSVPITVTKD